MRAELEREHKEHAAKLDEYHSLVNTLVAKTEQQATELEQLRAENAELRIRVGLGFPPDWSQAPAWAQWWAADASGHAYWFEDEPKIKDNFGYWSKGGGNCELLAGQLDFRWQSTKRRRPVS